MGLKKIRKHRKPSKWYPRVHMRKDTLYKARHTKGQKKMTLKKWGKKGV